MDYFVNFHDTNPTAPDAVLGIPLLPQSGSSVPAPGQMLLDTGVAGYIGVTLGATGSIDLIYPGIQPPIVRHLDNIRLAGTFRAIGPDQGRVDGFWGLALQSSSAGNRVLMVRQVGTGTTVNTVPVILDAATVGSFEDEVRAQLTQRGQKIPAAWNQARVVVRASSLAAITRAQRAVAALLDDGGDLAGAGAVSWRVLVPEQNNYLAAQREQTKIGHGSTFFLGLLVLLIAAGAAGLSIQMVLTRWRQYGILQAIGFTPVAVVAVLGIQVAVVLGGAIGLAGLARAVFPGQVSGMALLWAAGLCVVATALGAVPALVWPLRYGPAAALRETA